MAYSIRDENIALNPVEDRSLLRKRKREEEVVWKKAVKRKIKEEEQRVIEEQEKGYQVNSEMYALFNDLQGISKE